MSSKKLCLVTNNTLIDLKPRFRVQHSQHQREWKGCQTTQLSSFHQMLSLTFELKSK
jgi:hypothetical protein